MDRWQVGAVAVAAFSTGLAVRAGDGLMIAAMVVGMAASGLLGWWIRHAEADGAAAGRAEIARSIERQPASRSTVERLRQTVSGGSDVVLVGERHPIVTRPDEDTDQAPPTGERRYPRR